jgi:hypothetical protein
MSTVSRVGIIAPPGRIAAGRRPLGFLPAGMQHLPPQGVCHGGGGPRPYSRGGQAKCPRRGQEIKNYITLIGREGLGKSKMD